MRRLTFKDLPQPSFYAPKHYHGSESSICTSEPGVCPSPPHQREPDRHGKAASAGWVEAFLSATSESNVNTDVPQEHELG